MGPELSRRLGAAKAEFDTLSRVWSHAAISPGRKIQIFEACVVSKLLYGLHTAWLKSAELAKLDAFQARCLRKILHIPHSYYSRISNEEVLQRASRRSLRNILLARQLLLFHGIAQKPDDHPVRKAVFRPGSSVVQTPSGKRRRGRPRQAWVVEVTRHAKSVCQALHIHSESLHLLPPDTRKAAVREHCDA